MEEPEQAKEKKTAEELAAMIHEDLSKVDGCPRNGVTVTVYGIPWKSMLTFGAEAGPVRNKAELGVGIHRIQTSVLQGIGADLVDQPDAAAFLA